MSVDTRLRVAAAARAIAPHIRRTPTEHSPALSALAGCELYLKLENLQKTGAFKIRGALNKLLSMDAGARGRGVVTASAGNHGQGVALAAKLLGSPACVVLPAGVSLAKLTAIQRHGAEVIVTGDDYDAAHQTALELSRDRSLEYVPAFDDDDVIAGQGTLGLELLDDAPGLDAIVVPVGGGGLLAGIALAIRERPSTRPRLVGVQASGSPAFARSFADGTLVEVGDGTIADGIAVRRPAQRTLDIARDSVDEVRTVNDEAIARAIVLLLERHKLLAEGAGAAALAAVLEHPGAFGARVAVVISGGNIDPNLLGKVLQQGLASAGRYLAFRTWLDDKPGRLHALTGVLTEQRINILHVGIQRLGPYTALGKVGLDVIVETRDRAHASAVLELVRANGFPVEELLSTDPR